MIKVVLDIKLHMHERERFAAFIYGNSKEY